MVYRSAAAIALLVLIGISWADVIFSNDNIECCSLWKSAVNVTKPDGGPYSNCKILVSVMETRAGIETTLGRYTYMTDSKGKAVISYTPKRPGERLRINVACGENLVEKTITVTGELGGPIGPNIDLTLPPIETGQAAAIAFIIFAAVFVLKGKQLAEVFGKMGPKNAAAKKQDVEEGGMESKHLILDHERKMAAKLAKKHRRKEIKLGHDFIRKL